MKLLPPNHALNPTSKIYKTNVFYLISITVIKGPLELPFAANSQYLGTQLINSPVPSTKNNSHVRKHNFFYVQEKYLGYSITSTIKDRVQLKNYILGHQKEYYCPILDPISTVNHKWILGIVPGI